MITACGNLCERCSEDGKCLECQESTKSLKFSSRLRCLPTLTLKGRSLLFFAELSPFLFSHFTSIFLDLFVVDRLFLSSSNCCQTRENQTTTTTIIIIIIIIIIIVRIKYLIASVSYRRPNQLGNCFNIPCFRCITP